MENLVKPSAKSVLVPLGLWAGMSEADAAIQKKIYRSGTTALIIWNEEMEDIKWSKQTKRLMCSNVIRNISW